MYSLIIAELFALGVIFALAALVYNDYHNTER